MSEQVTSGAWCAPNQTIYSLSAIPSEMLSFISIPEVSRGGVRYSGNEPETNAARAKREARMEQCRIWAQGLPGVETAQVWLAIRDDGYDSDVLLEVATNPARAKAACQHDADSPFRPRKPEPIEWAGENSGVADGTSGSYYYRVERKPLMA